jgi:hypothetical protein
MVEQNYRFCLQAIHSCFPCCAIRAEDVRRRAARSGQSGTESPEQFFFDEAEQEDGHVRLHWSRGDAPSGADIEEQCACQHPSRFYQSAKAYGGREFVKGYDGNSCAGGTESNA